MPRSQKTLVQGLLFDVELEARDIAEVHSILPVSNNEGSDVVLAEELLEEILDLINLTRAAKRADKTLCHHFL